MCLRGNHARAGAWERARGGGVDAREEEARQGVWEGVGRTPPRARGRRTHSARAAGAPTATHPKRGVEVWRNRARRTRGL